MVSGVPACPSAASTSSTWAAIRARPRSGAAVIRSLYQKGLSAPSDLPVRGNEKLPASEPLSLGRGRGWGGGSPTGPWYSVPTDNERRRAPQTGLVSGQRETHVADGAPTT